MFNKKELEDLQSTVTALKEEQTQFKQLVHDQFQHQLKELKQEITSLKNNKNEEHTLFQEELHQFHQLNLNYKKEFDTFNLFKNQMTDKVLEKTEKELKQEVTKHLDELKVQKQEFTALQKYLEQLKEEVVRLQGMSQKIKDMDLELVNTMKKITEQDQEKVKLLKRVDDLQDLVAKIRQGKHR